MQNQQIYGKQRKRKSCQKAFWQHAQGTESPCFEKRAKAAAKRADSLTDAAIKEALKDDKKALAEYEAIKKQQGKGGGFFAAKKWYKENYQK